RAPADGRARCAPASKASDHNLCPDPALAAGHRHHCRRDDQFRFVTKKPPSPALLILRGAARTPFPDDWERVCDSERSIKQALGNFLPHHRADDACAMLHTEQKPETTKGRTCVRPFHQPTEVGELERAMGFEPTTLTLARLCSTPELHPRSVFNVSALRRLRFCRQRRSALR